jgi:hypothetical protein
MDVDRDTRELDLYLATIAERLYDGGESFFTTVVKAS